KFENNEIREFCKEKNDNEIRLFPNLKTTSIGKTIILTYCGRN
ncbi:MAG: hypothetical protein ACI8RP_002146, partial [Urechidicola sp.]